MSEDLSGKVVVVTGGVTGIGGAASRGFAKAGAKVLAQYHAGGPELAEFEKLGIKALQLDLTGPNAPQKLVDATIQAFGGIDVLVNNAGSMIARTPLADLNDEYIDLVFNLNCRQLVHCCRIAAEVMKKQGSGNIINVSSIAARNGGGPGASVYGAAKGFVSAFSKGIARELVEHKIRVNCVSPGTIHTAFHERFSDEARRIAMAKTVPMGYLGEAEDCTGTFLYLASDQLSGYVTGQVIEVNGGQLMP